MLRNIFHFEFRLTSGEHMYESEKYVLLSKLLTYIQLNILQITQCENFTNKIA
jgi:hypothetical protein